jgi:hypothetical protein
MENEKLETMKKEVMEINNKILKACEGDEKLRKIYKGCIIYLSPLYINSNILFFGINPGGGHYKEHGEIIQEFDPQNTDKHSGYGIWKEFEDCCVKLDKKFLLNDLVKTNRYFFATNNTLEMNKFFDLLPIEFRWEVARKQEEWTRILIKEISPKLIIAGGKTIWKKFNKLFPDVECLEEGKHIKVLKLHNIVLIAFERYYNKIVDKIEFIRCLDKYTQGLWKE